MNTAKPKSSGKPRIAFVGVGVGLHAEKGEGQGMPMLLALLERLAIDFDVVVYSLIRVKKSSLPGGIQLRQITKLRVPSYFAYLGLVLTFMLDQIRRPAAIINAVSAFPAGRIGVILGAIFKRPVMVHLIGSETVLMPEIEYGDLMIPRLKRIAYWVCSKADVLIVQTQYQKNMAERNLALTREATVISRRVDSKKFYFRERSIGLPIQFLHVASFHPVKDQETLFKAFAKISAKMNCYLTIVGDGFDAPAVKQMLSDLGIENNVNCLGLVKHSDIWRYYDQAHILLHTSRYESLCGAIQEAMASGVPVCGTEVGILSDLGDLFAVVVPVHNPDELASKCIELINDTDRYGELQRKAHEYIVSHDADWSAARYKELFQKWIGN